MDDWYLSNSTQFYLSLPKVERMQKVQDEEIVHKTWSEPAVTSQAAVSAPAIAAEYVVAGVEGKDFIYFTDVGGIMQPPPQLGELGV